MKKFFAGVLLALSCICSVWAQQKPDVIVRRNGEKIEGFVRQIRENDIYYGQANMPEDVFRTISINDVAAILYHDGKVQTFTQEPSPAPTAAPTPAQPGQPTQYVDNFATPAPPAEPAKPNANQLYAQGFADSKVHYTRYSGAVSGTIFVTLLVNPIIGLIPAIACSSTTPKQFRLDVPIKETSSDPNYMMGYRAGAKKKKSAKVWTGFGIGVAVYIPLIILLNSK